MPDNSVALVVASYILVEFWQHGDRDRLLREMRRILQPGGHLILAEPVRTTTHWLMIGPAAARLPAPAYWRDLLRTAGFVVTREKDVGGYYLCFRAEKPLPGAVQQLALDLGI
jgi:ubiquinone/menaquinone biosynthesis C-methylase UbiE